MKPARDLRLDLARGVALLAIFIDHAPRFWLHRLTPQAWQFCDFAEVFVFVSGYSAALAYLPLFEKRGWWAAQRKALERCWLLYRLHMLTLIATLLTVNIGLQWGLHPPSPTLELFAQAPRAYMTRALYFWYAPYMFSVLPLYVVLVMALPTMMAIAKRSPAVALAGSVSLYLATRWVWPAWIAPGRGYPHSGNAWYFDPAAWQLIFVAGLLAPRFRWPAFVNPRWMRLAALAVVLGCAVWTLRHSNFEVWERPGAGKPQLDPLRLLNFAAWLVLAQAWLGRVPANRWLVACGRRSLFVFCLGAWLATAIGIASEGLSGGWIVRTALMAAGAALLLILPAMQERTRSAAQPAGAEPVREQVRPSGQIG